MDKQTLLRNIDELSFPKSEYYILGGGALLMAGLRDKTADIDLCVSDELFRQLKETYHLNESDKNSCGFYKINAITEIVPKNKRDFLCDLIDGYQVEKLSTILAFKKMRNLPKDQDDIKNIEIYLSKNN